MSLGKANYLLRKLIDQGLVTINAAVGDMNKGRYLYLLTPEGEEAKAQMTVPFIKARVHEFEELRKRLLENLIVLHDKRGPPPPCRRLGESGKTPWPDRSRRGAGASGGGHRLQRRRSQELSTRRMGLPSHRRGFANSFSLFSSCSAQGREGFGTSGSGQ